MKTLKFASEKLTRAPQAELVHHVSWVTRPAGGGLTKDHKEHKERKASSLFIKYQFTSFAREKNTRNCLRQFEVVIRFGLRFDWVTRSA